MSSTFEPKQGQNALGAAGQKLLLRWSPDTILSRIVEDATKMIDGESGSLTVRDTHQNIYRFVALYNLPEELLSIRIPLNPKRCLTHLIYETGQPQIVDNYYSYPQPHPSLSRLGLKTALGVPLKVDNEVLGTLIVTTTCEQKRFQQRDSDNLIRFANMAGIAIQNAILHSENLHTTAQIREAKRKLVQQARRLRLLLSRVYDAHEEERRRIAMGLHDSVVQTVVASHMELSLAEQLLSNSPPDAARCISTASSFLQQAHDEIRGVIMNLRPMLLDKDGLIAAIDHLVKSTQDSLGLQCSLTVVGQIKPVDLNVEITVYRILQEAITNAWKHANATRLGVRIQFEAKRLIVVVEDNGRGFDISRADNGRASQHLGLVSMRERTESVRGSLTIDSRIGRGTSVRLVVPLKSGRSSAALPNQVNLESSRCPLHRLPAARGDAESVLAVTQAAFRPTVK